MSVDGFGARVGRRWVELYTRRLPVEEVELRRAEILSDLWEHHNDSVQSGHSKLRHNFEVIERVLSGIPADLSWRRGIQQSLLRPDTGDPMTTHKTIPRSTGALIISACLGIAAPFPFLSLLGTGLGTTEIVWILGSITLACILAVGLTVRLRASRPVHSTILLMIGAFAPTTAWFWFPPVYLLTAAVIITAVISARNPPVIQPSTA